MRIRILLFTFIGMWIGDPNFHFHADPDPDTTFQFDADPDPDPTSYHAVTFFQLRALQCFKMTPLRLPPFHFDADPDPAFHFDADPDPASQNDADSYLRIRISETGRNTRWHFEELVIPLKLYLEPSKFLRIFPKMKTKLNFNLQNNEKIFQAEVGPRFLWRRKQGWR